jgi:hypothetical protein
MSSERHRDTTASAGLQKVLYIARSNAHDKRMASLFTEGTRQGSKLALDQHIADVVPTEDRSTIV